MDFTIESDDKKIQVILMDSEVAALKPLNEETPNQRATVCVVAILRLGLSRTDRISEVAFCHPTDKDNLRSGRIRSLRRVLKEANTLGFITSEEKTLLWDKFFETIGEPNPRIKDNPAA